MTPPWKRNADKKAKKVTDFPRPSRMARELMPYQPASSLERIDPHGDPEPLKLDWNESTIAPSPLVIQRIMAFLGNTHHLNWYPDQHARQLTDQLSVYTGLNPKNILVTSGSDAALDVTCQTYLDPGDEVVVPCPTYTHFLTYAGARGARVHQVYGKDPFVLDIDAIMGALSYRTKMVYLVSPNNPTGVLCPASVVARIARAVPQAVVIVDEAYFEFAQQSVVELVETYPNVVVTRTFSKSFGIAGLRVGYMMASEGLITDVRRIFNPKSVNVLAQIGACAALDDMEYLYSYIDEVSKSKAMLCEWFESIGYKVHKSAANFLMVQVPHPGAFIQLCEEESVFIRDRSKEPQLERFVRISVGTQQQTNDLCERLTRVISRLPHLA